MSVLPFVFNPHPYETMQVWLQRTRRPRGGRKPGRRHTAPGSWAWLALYPAECQCTTSVLLSLTQSGYAPVSHDLSSSSSAREPLRFSCTRVTQETDISTQGWVALWMSSDECDVSEGPCRTSGRHFYKCNRVCLGRERGKGADPVLRCRYTNMRAEA